MDIEFLAGLLRSIIHALPLTLSLTFFAFILALCLAVLIVIVEYLNIPILKQFLPAMYPFFAVRH